MSKAPDKVPVAPRNVGSGRPHGSYMIKEDVIAAVKQFLDYAGCIQ